MSEATPQRPPLLLGLRSRFRLSLAATMAVRKTRRRLRSRRRAQTHAVLRIRIRTHTLTTQRRTHALPPSPLRQAFPALRRLQDIWNQARDRHAHARAWRVRRRR
jgi:hypothetical protein